MTIDRQVVAAHVRQLRATLPATSDLLVGLQRVTEATRTVVRVDGDRLRLEGSGPPWVEVGRQMRYRQAVVQRWLEGEILRAPMKRTGRSARPCLQRKSHRAGAERAESMGAN
jgi:hypothetical protein